MSPEKQRTDYESPKITFTESINALGIDLDKLPVSSSYEELECNLPEVAAMKGYDQLSDYHDLPLDQHSKALVKSLASDEFTSSHPKKDLILLAGALHDIGKMSEKGQQVSSKDPNT